MEWNCLYCTSKPFSPEAHSYCATSYELWSRNISTESPRVGWELPAASCDDWIREFCYSVPLFPSYWWSLEECWAIVSQGSRRSEKWRIEVRQRSNVEYGWRSVRQQHISARRSHFSSRKTTGCFSIELFMLNNRLAFLSDEFSVDLVIRADAKSPRHAHLNERLICRT